jgi:pSer/pThr/pTyr-binding forkhead associated (FHA) protein
MDAPILRFDRQSSPKTHIRLSRSRVSLEITKGRVRERLRPIHGKVFLIGAASDCDLVLGGMSFPEAYAYVFVQGSYVTVRRLGSGPALFVEGESVETADLADGDSLAFGPFELRVAVEKEVSTNPAGNRYAEMTDDDPVSLLLSDIRRGLEEE